MLRSDAQVRDLKVTNITDNINAINVDAIANIERELDPYDVNSMVFLLYKVPDLALQRLIVHQRVASDVGDHKLNLLHEWAQHSHSSRPDWKCEFLEALAICQLNNVIRKLGFNTSSVQKQYLPNNIHAFANTYINPMKKALYKLCENVTSNNLRKLQNTLKTYDMDTTEYTSCEQVLLELMCKKFISIDSIKVTNGKYQVENLVKILQAFPDLKNIAEDLRVLQRTLNNEPSGTASASTSTPVDKDDHEEDDGNDKFTVNDFGDLFDFLNDLKIDINDKSEVTLKSDTNKKSDEDFYTIKNPKRIGVCYIINQEDFHPSKESIESNSQSRPLDKRTGSNRDQKELEKTMTMLNFEVISHCNLDHKKMIEFIDNMIQFRVHPDDSMFILCILSHGVKGHVYAADSVKVKIDLIQNLLDEGLRKRQLDIPKVMILQACRVNNDESSMQLVADGPIPNYQKKLDFLIYWATAPELEAFRHEKNGSVFIQILCHLINKHAKQDHLFDIFTRVTNGVSKICGKFQRPQAPTFESSLRKKLYLQVPE